jgi:glycosyltransferase involved in cell wall biosynthesis
MKIGYFITLFPYTESFKDASRHSDYPVGGAENVAYYLARHMALRGHDVTVFTSSATGKNKTENQGGIKVLRYRKNLKFDKAIISFGMYSGMLKHDVDLVHLHFTTPPGDMAGLYYAGIKRKPFIVTYHGDGQGGYGSLVRRLGLGIYNSLVVDRILSRANTVISPSEPYIDQSRFLPKFKRKVVTIPNGIDFDEIDVSYGKEKCREILSLDLSSKVILFVGALIAYKSPQLLIEALPQIVSRVPEARLIFVGDGPMRRELQNLAVRKGVADKVTFAGVVVGQKKMLYYQAADVFALPSALNTEVFPIVLLEASVSGLPMVVSNLPTFKCIVEEGYNGFTANPGDFNSLADKISSILSQPGLRITMGNNAKLRVKDFSWSKIAKATEEIYEMALENDKQ